MHNTTGFTMHKKIAITSIQRNRNKYIVEWIAFHLAAGFNQFYIYCHKTNDGMQETLLQLSKHYPIQVFSLELEDFPQIAAYQHAWENFGNQVDWMAFIDGDEFLFPTQAGNMHEALLPYEDKTLSAIGVFWKCYGSNGHDRDPDGLIIEDYPRHSNNEFLENRHIKSIVRGGEHVVPNRSHLFETAQGTFDENMRPITHGWMKELSPSYDMFRINHYVVQSKQFFFEIKQNMGAADLPAGMRRDDNYFAHYDRNEEDDGLSRYFLQQTKEKIAELQAILQQPKIQQTVQNYSTVANPKHLETKSAGDSAAPKSLIFHILENNTAETSVLDIGFGAGKLGELIKSNPATAHWSVDGIDGFEANCHNIDLLEKKIYRNIWYGLAQDLPSDWLRSYQIICLLDVIEHLTADTAKWLLRTLLTHMGDDAFLFISTPLWFYPQDTMQQGDLEEHLIGIPATSIMALIPKIYSINSPLVGGFVLGKRSLDFIEFFQPTSDKRFSYERGVMLAQACGCQYQPGSFVKLW